jgi:hypothetical protein
MFLDLHACAVLCEQPFHHQQEQRQQQQAVQVIPKVTLNACDPC